MAKNRKSDYAHFSLSSRVRVSLGHVVRVSRFSSRAKDSSPSPTFFPPSTAREEIFPRILEKRLERAAASPWLEISSHLARQTWTLKCDCEAWRFGERHLYFNILTLRYLIKGGSRFSCAALYELFCEVSLFEFVDVDVPFRSEIVK